MWFMVSVLGDVERTRVFIKVVVVDNNTKGGWTGGGSCPVVYGTKDWPG